MSEAVDPLRFDGQRAVVTGAGHGLGRSAALTLAARGAHVVVNDLPGTDGASSSAEEVVAEIRAAGGSATAVATDATTPEGADRLAAVAAELGGADVLAHAAALVRRVPLDEAEVDFLQRAVAINLTGAIMLARAFLGQLRAHQGRVVLFGSGAGSFGFSGQVAYGATKAGLVGLARCLAEETRPDRVRVNVVLPYAVTNPGRTTLEWPAEDLATVATRGTTEHVTPLVVLLCHASLAVSGRAYSAMGGRFARVATLLGEGWTSSSESPVTPEELASRFSTVDSLDGAWEPERFEDELTHVARTIRD
jgi:NAD(P)-dependent dehydrogenase (short-subunit alcohol dehydrogenase family)